MGSETVLKGCLILIVEDDPLIRSELTDLFESAGAHIVAARTCEEAVSAILQHQTCAALLDYGIRGDNVAQLGKLLSEGQIPYMFYTGYSDLEQIYPNAIIVEKPACGKVLLGAMADLVVSRPLNRVCCVAKSKRQSANVKSPARHGAARLQR
jgi:CheY-like chemotaxis protein